MSSLGGYATPKPTFICVPGANHSANVFEPLKTALASYGYTVLPLTLPSIGSSPPTYDFTEDVTTIRNAVSHFVERGDEVILVLHDYAGIPGGESLQGLGRPERKASGLRGGVIRLIFIMAWMVKEDFQGSPRGDVSARTRTAMSRSVPVFRLLGLELGWHLSQQY